MKVFGIAGHSGMGNTTLLERLVPELTARGLVVSLIKHSHKAIEIDRPGKDSYRLREVGCSEVLLLGNERWALMHELRGADEPSLEYLLSRLQHCDLVLVEGFKGGDFPKLEVWRAEVGKPTLWPDWPGIEAIASDSPAATTLANADKTPPWLALHDAAAIAAFVRPTPAQLERPGRGSCSATTPSCRHQRGSAMNHDGIPDERPAVAAIGHDGRTDIDDLLVVFADQQRRAGRKVLGLVMKPRERGDGCKAAMVLTDIDTGEEYLVSQALGSESASCSADPQGFARASRVLRDALDRAPDLVVCNRFGSLEATNGGFVAELLALLERGIPVLTVVAPAHVDAWQRFIGEAPLLPIEPDAWAAWLDAVLLQRGRSAVVPAHAAPA